MDKKKPTLKDLIWEYLYFGEGYNRIDDCSVTAPTDKSVGFYES